MAKTTPERCCLICHTVAYAIQMGPKVTSLLNCCALRGRQVQHLHDVHVRGLHDAHRTRILRVTFAWHTLDVSDSRRGFTPDARVTPVNPRQMLRAPAARGARNKELFLLDPSQTWLMMILIMYICLYSKLRNDHFCSEDLYKIVRQKELWQNFYELCISGHQSTLMVSTKYEPNINSLMHLF
jgi:hypothetical protein